jgi:NTP pyrophosphatase (non-canonical NTP hydrolase)
MSEKLREIQKICYKGSKKSGYVELWNRPTGIMEAVKGESDIIINEDYYKQEQKVFDIAELGLIPTEVAEAQEEVRNKETNNEHLAEECADVIIRTLNFMSRKGLDATEAINKKIEKNSKRETLHGRAV